MFVGKGKILVPVVRGHIVPSTADVIGDAPVDRLVNRGHALGRQSPGAKEPIDRVGTFCCKKLPSRVGPPVTFRACNVEGTRGDKAKQHMLVEGQFILFAVVFFEIAAEPVGKRTVDSLHCLAEPALGERGSAAA